ncbi:MAG: hydroxymethylglutaryl-CoA synthase family protein [Dehalococcoidia bacterium]
MAGIKSYGAYIPKYRLGKETVGWGAPTEKAVANFDEDSITMAVAAAVDCLRGLDRSQVDGILFATTTSPYAEKQGAALIATALDLRRDITSADVTDVLRAGTTALKMATDAVRAGTADNMLVIASDCRMATPKGALDRAMGDGAAALLIAKDGTVAEVESEYHITDHMLDVWRSADESTVRSWEDRFVIEEGLLRVLPEAISAFMAKSNLTPGDFQKVAYYSIDARRHADLARMMKFEAAQVQDPLYSLVGNTGTAYPLMLLVAALEEAKAGDRILVAGYGDGSDVYSIKVGEGVEKVRQGRRGVKKHVEAKQVLKSYDEYLRWRGMISVAGVRRPEAGGPSASVLWRETDRIVRLYGSKCKKCGYVQFPPQRVCVECQAKDEMDPVRLSDKPATVFTYAMDYLSGTTDVPLVITVINFEGGGRMLAMMTDREIDQLSVGMPVEMSFRKIRSAGGIHNYYWKSTPVRA